MTDPVATRDTADRDGATGLAALVPTRAQAVDLVAVMSLTALALYAFHS